jgi:hypothetical protein
MRSQAQELILCSLCGLCWSHAAFAGTSMFTSSSYNFASDPLAADSPWTFGVGSNANGQFVSNSDGLTVLVNSALPTARLDLPLGTTLNDTSTFILTSRFSFHVTTASPDQFAQIAFGLTNHTLTGGDRTGSLADQTSDNTFNTVEFNYFPNVSTLFGGPTLTPTVFGGQGGSEPDFDAFSNFASIFDPVSNPRP